MKTCTRCKLVKGLTEFSKRKTMKDGLQLQCKVCCREQAKAFYNKNPTPYKERAKVQRDKVSAYLMAFADKIKQERGCACCPERTLCVLDFHHHKARGIPVTRAANHSYKMFEREINKCVVLCANCHRKTHGGLVTLTDDMLCNIVVPRLTPAEEA